jgi:hypothetical protein
MKRRRDARMLARFGATPAVWSGGDPWRFWCSERRRAMRFPADPSRERGVTWAVVVSWLNQSADDWDAAAHVVGLFRTRRDALRAIVRDLRDDYGEPVRGWRALWWSGPPWHEIAWNEEERCAFEETPMYLLHRVRYPASAPRRRRVERC